MKEINNYKYLFFKKVYYDLQLNLVEKSIEDKSIKSLNVISNDGYTIFSHYFFLLNNVNIDNLTDEQLKEFHLYFSKDIDTITDDEINKINAFIDNTYKLLLFPKGDEKYVYYGPISDDHMCPRDSIVFGLYYDAFSGDAIDVENSLADIINYIQFDLSTKVNKKISVLPFNQFTLEDNSKIFNSKNK